MNESGLLTPQHPGDEAKDRANTTTPAEETKVCMLTAENLGKSPSYMTEECVQHFRSMLADTVRPEDDDDDDDDEFIKSYRREPPRKGTEKLPLLPNWAYFVWENPRVLHCMHQYHRELRKAC